MIYLDYSATTPVNKEVLDSFVKATENYIGNPNSLHSLGVDAKNLIEEATNQIAALLKVKPNEIIYTSGASESNNTAIKGVCSKYANRGKHIITTSLEHSSVVAPLAYLQKQGFVIDCVSLNSDGTINLDNFKSLLNDDTILVTIASVNSEIGIKQPIDEIGKIVKQYPKCIFHVDATQSIGKEEIQFNNIDLVSFSAHKFYGIKGIGCLLKKEKLVIDPLIHGGKSTTSYRSGTPSVALIVSLAKALRLALENFNNKYDHVLELNTYLKDNLKNIKNIHINSNDKCIPHILNVSIKGIKPETMQHALEKRNIYISTQTACSASNTRSQSVYALTNNNEYAETSIRISLSYLTTKEEITTLIDSLKIEIDKLR